MAIAELITFANLKLINVIKLPQKEDSLAVSTGKSLKQEVFGRDQERIGFAGI
jgi:hypothetical protein